jgi:hypothetical protein
VLAAGRPISEPDGKEPVQLLVDEVVLFDAGKP